MDELAMQGQPIGQVGGLAITTPSPYSRLGRSIRQAYGGGLQQAAAIDVAANLTAMKVSAATNLARGAQMEIATMSQMEAQLKQAIPEAAERLEQLGSVATMEVTNLLISSMSQMRRM